jgi:recombination protein RecT
MAAKSVTIKDGKATNALQKEKEKPTTMIGWIQGYEKQIAKALPSVMTPERFTRIAMTAVTQTPQLGECTPGSFIGALLTAAQLGLEPNTPLGQAYLIPFYNGKTRTLEAQFQLGYRGMIALAHRSGELQNVEAHIVYENDEFEYELGLNPKLRHIPAMKNRGEIAWVYAVYRLTSGGFGFEVMSVEDVNKHRDKFSKAAGKGFSPWTTAWEEMAKKTVIKRALKYAPLQSDFTRAMNEDEATLDFTTDGDDYNIMQQNNYGQENIVEVDPEDIEVTDVDPETGEIKE